MELWRKVWREGIAPQLSRKALEALASALESDDSRLIQQSTTLPPPFECVETWPVERACAIGFCGWQGEGLDTVAAVEGYFARVCIAANRALDEGLDRGTVHHFLNWFDGTPRVQMRRELLAEVRLALAAKETV